MVTVLMAILIFMGIGWQFAFEQWGFINGVKTSSIHSGTLSYPIVYPNCALSVLIGATGISDLLAASVKNNSSFIWSAGQDIMNLYAYWISFGK